MESDGGVLGCDEFLAGFRYQLEASGHWLGDFDFLIFVRCSFSRLLIEIYTRFIWLDRPLGTCLASRGLPLPILPLAPQLLLPLTHPRLL
jgi:hypothetical protein